MGASASHETNESINADTKDGWKYSATFQDNHFAEGACRWAFQGTLHGGGPRNNTKCVTKVFKNEVATKMKDWAPDIAASVMAFRLAKRFQDEYIEKISNNSSGNEIEFLIPLIATIKNISHFHRLLIKMGTAVQYVRNGEVVAIEPFLEGYYDKFNSNNGYENNPRGMHDLMTAFCHWTWDFSGHKYMVCDLQGVKSGRKYILTDPAIHSNKMLFGATDLGVVGMERVLVNHQCNVLCRVLGLKNPMTGVSINPGSRPTTYRFQVPEQEMFRAKRGQSAFFPIYE